MDSEDASANTEIAKSDVKTAQPMAKQLTARPAEGLPEHPMGVAQETDEHPGGAGVSALVELDSEDFFKELVQHHTHVFRNQVIRVRVEGA